MNIYAQDCGSSEKAKHHVRRANAITKDMKKSNPPPTSKDYEKLIYELKQLIIYTPDCPEVYKKLYKLYIEWAEFVVIGFFQDGVPAKLGTLYAGTLYAQRSYTSLDILTRGISGGAPIGSTYSTNRDRGEPCKFRSAENFLKVFITMYNGDKEYYDRSKEYYLNELAELEVARAKNCNDDFLDYAYKSIQEGNSELAERYIQLYKFISREFAPPKNRDKFEKYVEMAFDANSFYEKGERKQAKQIYAEMLKINPDDRYVRNRYEDLDPSKKAKEPKEESNTGWYLAYNFDLGSPDVNFSFSEEDCFSNKSLIGLSWGSLRNRGVGFYMSYRSNIFLYSEKKDMETILKDKSYQGYGIWDNNLSRSSKAFLTCGITKNIIYPYCFFYLGAGASYSSVSKQLLLSTETTEWAKIPDSVVWGLNPELGITFNLGGFLLRAGINQPLPFEDGRLKEVKEFSPQFSFSIGGAWGFGFLN